MDIPTSNFVVIFQASFVGEMQYTGSRNMADLQFNNWENQPKCPYIAETGENIYCQGIEIGVRNFIKSTKIIVFLRIHGENTAKN